MQVEPFLQSHGLCDECYTSETEKLEWHGSMCVHFENMKCKFSWCSYAFSPQEHPNRLCMNPWCDECKRWSAIPNGTIYCSYCLTDLYAPHVHNGISIVRNEDACVHKDCSKGKKLCIKCNVSGNKILDWNFKCDNCGCYFGDAQCICSSCI